MSRSVLKQIPEALADPIAIFRDERRDAFVFMLDVVDDAGNTVVVPVVFNAHGRNAEINLATTAYGNVNFSQTGTRDPPKIHKPIGFIFETRLVRTSESFLFDSSKYYQIYDKIK